MIAGGDINMAEVVEEVRAAFDRYERAFTENDIAVLDELFWDDPRVVRFGGAGENLYGMDAIRAFRVTRAPTGLERALANTVITTYGRDFATATTEFFRKHDGTWGRQSQIWARMAPGWRIVSAHISMLPRK